MPRRLLFALLVLVAAPLVLLGWLSSSAYRQQQETARQELKFLYEARLDDHDRSLARVFDRYARDLESTLRKSDSPVTTLRKMDREHPAVRQTMFVDASGLLIYPPKPGSDASEDAALFASMPAITDSKPELTDAESADPDADPAKTESTSGKGNGKSKPARTKRAPTQLGKGSWQVWYMDEGLQLIYWIPRRDGTSVGILLERARWVSDLTAKLPNSGVPLLKGIHGRRAGFTALVDESNQFVYRWGDNGGPVVEPLAQRALSWPLSSWKLEYHSDNLLPETAAVPLVASLVGVGVLLLSLGAYVLTSVQRQMRRARNRVGFASQVSHELRTPLTNIRLYAELAESDLEKLPPSSSRDSIESRLQVIDTESRRLGRLVSGVLEMIRDHGGPQGPRLAPANADEIIEQTLKQFAPSFANAGLQVQRRLNADRCIQLDVDILEMVLVNLLSNIEKYASEGEQVFVSSELSDMKLVIRVADQGPGIPWRKRRSIFRAFSRLDDSIDAPSGTGIGLTIARRLARRHGGDLHLIQEVQQEKQGACFELRLPVQPVDLQEKQE